MVATWEKVVSVSVFPAHPTSFCIPIATRTISSKEIVPVVSPRL
jgi:hypothetical protein